MQIKQSRFGDSAELGGSSFVLTSHLILSILSASPLRRPSSEEWILPPDGGNAKLASPHWLDCLSSMLWLRHEVIAAHPFEKTA